ncbi:MAG TPA: SpoIVB peptidase S55 domain-containing protein [Thermoanaerobaculia bacterium]|nr:SpoIVB peptidase S55 domain-containing protein [Thermoanaerobaculia bacterium]
MIRPLRPFIAAALLLFASSAAFAEIMPVSEIRKGMKGYGLTIFEGTEIQKFDVEILGVLSKMGPGQDLILGRVDHEVVNHSGIIAGMSGSPVFIDGKLIGALAYSWQFAKDPVAGITPIQEMLDLERSGGSKVRGAMSPVSSASFIANMLDPKPETLQAMFEAFRPAPVASGALPVSIPVSFSNFSSDTLERFGSLFEAGGFLPVPAGSTAGGASKVENRATPFKPGDAIGAVLLQGDFSVAATGTVTHVDGNKIWAFGHPFLDMGAIDFPMATSEVIAVLPSLARSFKFSNTGEVVGALRQDRSPGILGYVGETSPMIPVKLTIEGSRGEEVYEFELARHPMLSPLLLAMVADSVVAVGQRAAGERTIVLESEIDVEGFDEPVRVRDGWAGSEARQAIPVYLAILSSYLLSNEFTDAPIHEIRVRLRHEDDLRMARIIQASVIPPADGVISPGDTIGVRALLKPFRGEAFSETFEVKVPDTASVGNAYIFVGSGRMANRLDFSLVPPNPHSLKQMVDVIERLRSSTDLTVGFYEQNDGAVSAGVYHPNLPPSVQAIVAADSTNSSSLRVKVHGPVKESRALDYIVDGAVRVDLQIRPAL